MTECDSEIFRASGVFRWFALLLGIGGVLVGVAAIPENGAAGIFIVFCFSILTLAALRQVWPNANYVRTTPEGFEVRSILQHYFVPWGDVDEFFVWREGFWGYIGFRLRESSCLKPRRGEMTLGVGRRVPTGVDGLLPYRYSNLTPEQMVRRLEKLRERALSSTEDS